MKIIFEPTREGLGEYPPMPAKKVVPTWYKDMEPALHESTAMDFVKFGGATSYTIKRCVPVLDFLTSGYVIRNQSDFMLSSNDAEDQSIWWYHHVTCVDNHVSYHPHKQCPININDSKKSYFKIKTGYRIKTPPGYSCLFYQSPYAFEQKFTLFPGIVDTDVYDHEVLFPGYINESKDNITIEAGEPLIWVLPFKRDEWEAVVTTNVVDLTKSNFGFKMGNYLSDVYRRFFHHKKIYE